MDIFENTLNQIHTILRKEGITGMDSIKHCLSFIVSRFLTKANCLKLGIEEKYSFENLIETSNNELFELFYNNKNDCLSSQIQKRIEEKSNLKNIFNKLMEFDINKLSNNFDIVGIIYELHLKNEKNLGQFFTNRLVIDYMVKLCNPKIKKNGEIETILDPTMGTAGFLALSIKHLENESKKNNKPINWSTSKNNIFGFDVDENFKNIAIQNLFLETGQIFDKTLIKRDTLQGDFLIDKVDVILSNQPFGIKALKSTDCCEKVKKLKIDGNKTGPLFLQLTMQSLNENGRCAVIVPDGVIYNDSKQHTETRKHLCENFNLKKVISLDDGLNLNTGVKSSILFFINNGKTTEVEFCKIKLNNEKIVEETIYKVTNKNIVKNEYSLFVDKYKLDNVESEEANRLYLKSLMRVK